VLIDLIQPLKIVLNLMSRLTQGLKSFTETRVSAGGDFMRFCAVIAKRETFSFPGIVLHH